MEGLPGFHDIRRDRSSETVPGLIVYRIDAPLFFANARFLRERVRELLAGEEGPVRWLVIDLGAAFDLDVTAADSLAHLREELAGRGVVLALAQPRAPLRTVLRRTGLMKQIGLKRVFPTVGSAVRAYTQLPARS